MVKIILDKKKCIGCGTCVVLYPEVFSFDENENVAKVNEEAVGTADPERLKSTVQSCPSEALSMLSMEE